MDDQQFYDELMNNVRARAEVDRDFTESAFLQEAADRLFEAEEIGDLIAVNFVGTGSHGRRLAVSAYEEDESDDSIALTIVNFSPRPHVETLSEPEARRQFSALKLYVDESLSGSFREGREESSPEYALAETIRRRARGVTRYRFYLLTNKALSTRAKDFPSDSVNDIPIEYHIWDIERFKRVFESTLGREELTIDLTEWLPEGVSALKASAMHGDTTTYLCVLPARLIADLYGRYGGRLLQSNVRSYLSNIGKVNHGIRETVLSKPELFLAYNNGITATASAVEFKDSTIIKITDLQIVNGGQTTASLFYVGRERRNLVRLDEAYVQAKLVVVPPEVAQQLVPNISRFANSQNRVSEADFFSNSAYHVRIEELSRRILTPSRPGSTFQSKWFYERTRGQYLSERSRLLTKATQDKFVATYPKSQVITKTDAAKYVMSWERVPHKVSAGAQKNFVAFANKVAKEWESSNESFNDSYFKDLVAQAILYNTLRSAIARQSWYEQGYLAQIVTYTIAKISDIVLQGHHSKFNFDAVWQRQSVSHATVRYALEVGQQVLNVLTWAGRSKANVTEWAKDEECWKRMQGVNIEMPADFAGELVSGASIRSVKKEAREQQEMDNGIRAQSSVLRIGCEEWLDIKRFMEERGLLGPTAAGILQIVTRSVPGIPSERQAIRLLDLRRRALANGYGRDEE